MKRCCSKAVSGVAILVLTASVLLHVSGCGDDAAAPPPSAELANLTLSVGTLSPLFSPGTTFYTVDVASDVTSLTVTPTAVDGAATIEVDGVAAPSGTPTASIPLEPGANLIFIDVIATDGVTQEFYAVAVMRAEADAELVNLTISEGSLSPVFSPDSTFYVAECILPAAITVTPTASDSGATITVNGEVVDSGTLSQPIVLTRGANTITVLVTASDGVTQMSYTVIVFGYGQRAYLKASNTGVRDFFGSSVAVDGDTVVVGADGEASNSTGVDGADNDLADVSGAAYVFTRSAGVWSQEAYLKASNTETYDFFGCSVAVDGDTVVVGARQEGSNATGADGADNNLASYSGAAYVFTRSGGVWSQQAYLKASNTDTYDFFGRSVAVDGDTIVVGASGEDSNATGMNGDESNNDSLGSGAAYVFTRSAGVWSQQAYLKASNTGANDSFGYSVAIYDDTVVVGAQLEDSDVTGVNGADNDLAGGSGAAYVFTRSAGVWSQQAYLKASNTEADDHFGCSVAVDDDTVVVGAYWESSDATGVNGDDNNDAYHSGAAYVFTRSGSAWSQQAYLKASNTDTYDWFGTFVAVDGDTVVVGACYEDSDATGVDGVDNDDAIMSGAAYVFTRSGGVWSPQAYLKASNTEASDSFGCSVAIDGGTVVVGGYTEDSSATGVDGDQTANDADNSGAVYVFE